MLVSGDRRSKVSAGRAKAAARIRDNICLEQFPEEEIILLCSYRKNENAYWM